MQNETRNQAENVLASIKIRYEAEQKRIQEEKEAEQNSLRERDRLAEIETILHTWCRLNEPDPTITIEELRTILNAFYVKVTRKGGKKNSYLRYLISHPDRKVADIELELIYKATNQIGQYKTIYTWYVNTDNKYVKSAKFADAWLLANNQEF